MIDKYSISNKKVQSGLVSKQCSNRKLFEHQQRLGLKTIRIGRIMPKIMAYQYLHNHFCIIFLKALKFPKYIIQESWETTVVLEVERRLSDILKEKRIKKIKIPTEEGEILNYKIKSTNQLEIIMIIKKNLCLRSKLRTDFYFVTQIMSLFCLLGLGTNQADQALLKDKELFNEVE